MRNIFHNKHTCIPEYHTCPLLSCCVQALRWAQVKHVCNPDRTCSFFAVSYMNVFPWWPTLRVKLPCLSGLHKGHGTDYLPVLYHHTLSLSPITTALHPLNAFREKMNCSTPTSKLTSGEILLKQATVPIHRSLYGHIRLLTEAALLVMF